MSKDLIIYTEDDFLMPHQGSEEAAAIDLRSAEEDFEFKKGEIKVVDTGISVDFPEGYAGFVIPRSGLAAKHGISIVNSPGLCDFDYKGNIKVILINQGKDNLLVQKYERIAQLMLVEYTKVNMLRGNKELRETTSRGDKGLGSTGSR